MKFTSRSSMRVAACSLALVASLTAPAHAQQELEVCSNCAIEVFESKLLPVLDSTGVLPPTVMQVTPLGSDAFAVLGTDLASVRLDRAGNVSLLLPKGAGPFEQRAVIYQLAHGDTTFLFDVALRRRTMLDRGRPSSMSEWRARPFVSIAKLPDGWVVNAAMRTPESIGYPFHILNDSGVVLKSFGRRLEVRSSEGDPVEFRHRVLYDKTGDRILTVKERKFEISGYRTDGTRLFRLEGTPSFWRDASAVDVSQGVKMPNTYVRDARIDSKGRVWLAIIMASDHWEKAIGPVRQDDGKVVKQITSIERGYKSLVVVVDVAGGRVTGILEQPGQFQGFSGESSAIFWEGNDDTTGESRLREVSWKF